MSKHPFEEPLVGQLRQGFLPIPFWFWCFWRSVSGVSVDRGDPLDGAELLPSWRRSVVVV